MNGSLQTKLPLSSRGKDSKTKQSIFCAKWSPSFGNPVLLYSIGKDSSVLLRLAVNAFYPAKPPFTLLHVDTKWKFREMIAFREATVQNLGLKLIVHVNEEGLARGIDPIASGSALHTRIMKTEALKQALNVYDFDAAIGGARRDEEKSRAKERIFSFRGSGHVWDRAGSARNCGTSSIPASLRASRAGLSVVELDRGRRLAVHPR